MRLLLLALATAYLGLVPIVSGWDYDGHRAVNSAALEALPSDFPEFVKTKEARERIAFLGGEPDRWRNSPELPLKHASSPDHYIDFEDLAFLDLTPETLTEFRYRFVAQIALARQGHAERFPVINPERNQDHTRELIGFLPWAIAENYARLRSGFSYLKALEENGTAEEVANAQANIIYVMGVMGHFVGDGAQPLHTSRYANGWEGENPKNYTTVRTFHAWIDSGFLRKTGPLDPERISHLVRPAQLLPQQNPPAARNAVFSAIVQYLVEQHPKVELLYEMEKAGKLSPENPQSKEGRQFLEGQIAIGAHMLSSLWLTAWRDAPPDTYLRANLIERKIKRESGK